MVFSIPSHTFLRVVKFYVFRKKILDTLGDAHLFFPKKKVHTHASFNAKLSDHVLVHYQLWKPLIFMRLRNRFCSGDASPMLGLHPTPQLKPLFIFFPQLNSPRQLTRCGGLPLPAADFFSNSSKWPRLLRSDLI
jgi:hypothetical protein